MMSRDASALPNDNTTPPLDEGFSKHDFATIIAIRALFARHIRRSTFANAAAVVARASSMADSFVPTVDRNRPAFPVSIYAPSSGKGLTRHQYVMIQAAAGIAYGNVRAGDYANGEAALDHAKEIVDGVLDADVLNDPAFPTIGRTELDAMGVTKLEYALEEISSEVTAKNAAADTTITDAEIVTAARDISTTMFDSLS